MLSVPTRYIHIFNILYNSKKSKIYRNYNNCNNMVSSSLNDNTMTIFKQIYEKDILPHIIPGKPGDLPRRKEKFK